MCGCRYKDKAPKVNRREEILLQFIVDVLATASQMLYTHPLPLPTCRTDNPDLSHTTPPLHPQLQQDRARVRADREPTQGDDGGGEAQGNGDAHGTGEGQVRGLQLSRRVCFV